MSNSRNMLSEGAKKRVEGFKEDPELAAELETSAELLVAARSWNYDRGLDGPRRLLAHSAADRAVALAIFWLLGSELVLDCSSVEEALEEFDDEAAEALALCQKIQEEVVAGAYPQGETSFDPTDDDGTDWTMGYDGDLSHFLFPVHPLMLSQAGD